MIREIELQYEKGGLYGARVKTGLLVLASVLPYFLGWICGAAVRSALWIVASFLAGYSSGRGGQ